MVYIIDNILAKVEVLVVLDTNTNTNTNTTKPLPSQLHLGLTIIPSGNPIGLS